MAPYKDCSEVDGGLHVLADEGGVLAIADTTDLDLETESKSLHIVVS